MPIILILILLLLLGGGATFPVWSYNTDWGHGPFGGTVGLILLIIIILFILGKL